MARVRDVERGRRIATVVVTFALAALIGAAGLSALAQVAARAVATPEPVAVVVVDVRVEERILTTRLGRDSYDARIATVETADGDRADVRSDDLDTGDRATVFRNADGGLTEAPQPPPGVLDWALSVGATSAALVLAVVGVRLARAELGRRRSPSA